MTDEHLHSRKPPPRAGHADHTLRCGGVVVCGGGSTRMGSDKCWLPFGDETMLARVVRLLGEAVGPVVVVAADGQTLPPLAHGVLIARDEHADRGPLEGLRVGLAALDGLADAAFATSCDVPLLSPRLVRRMVELLAEDGAHEIAAPRDAERRYPLAAAYRLRVAHSIAALQAESRSRLMDLLAACRTRDVAADALRDADPQLHSLVNCNRPEDYAAALALAGVDCARGVERLE